MVRNIKTITQDIIKKAVPVYNQRLAGYLMLQGFVLMDMKENVKYKGRNVFYFMDSILLQQNIQDYLNRV